jgi:hypothetical protein
MRLSREVAAAAACALVIGLSGCGVAYPAVEGKFSRTLNVSGFVDLEVSNGSGKIDVRTGGPGTVQVLGTIRAGNDWRGGDPQDKVRYLEANPPIEQTGNTIRIGRIDNPAYRNNVSISYEIVIPSETRVKATTGSGSIRIEGTRGPVDAGTGSGSIRVFDVREGLTAHTGSGSIHLEHIGGSVETRTGSGSIRAEGIAGPVKAETGSGSIFVEMTAGQGAGSRDAEVTTGSGSIEVSGVDGSLQARTGSGGIRAGGNPSGDWDVDAASGSVTLRLEDGSSCNLVAHSSSGRITAEHPGLVTESVGRRDMRGKVGGGGPVVQVRTRSGGITIR